MKKVWDKFFEKNDDIKTFGKHKFDYSQADKDVVQLVPVFERNKVRKILDLGCGEGRNARYLAKQGFLVNGLDISKKAIENTKRKNGKVKYRLGDMKEMSYADDYFDATISTQTIFHGRIKDIRKTIKEIIRVNKNGALVFVTLQPVRGNEYRMGKKLEEGTYISSAGEDKGEIHHFFTKTEIQKEFADFEILDLYLERKKNYWYLLLKNRKG